MKRVEPSVIVKNVPPNIVIDIVTKELIVVAWLDDFDTEPMSNPNAPAAAENTRATKEASRNDTGVKSRKTMAASSNRIKDWNVVNR